MRSPPIKLVVFVVGAASLGTEIAAARLLAPFFGASDIVWANTIAVVLVALAVGYAAGGRIADRSPSAGTLASIVLAASALLAVVPFVSHPFLDAAARALDTISVGGFLGSLFGVLGLVAVPVLLLGMVAPFAIRLSVSDVEHSGSVSGRLYAISTAGSLVGTFLAALLLIPAVGTRRTFLIFALSLALVAVPGLARRYVVVPLALAALIALPVGVVKATSGERVLAELETPYQFARVVEVNNGDRWLELNEGVAIHSLWRPGSYLTGNYWDEALVLPFAARARPPRSIAILGNAAGTTARAYGHFFPGAAVDGVELDGALSTLGRRWFGLSGPHLHTITADARPFLRRPGRRYDVIVVDAYRQPYIPFYLTTREFFAEVRARLNPLGVVIVNVGHPPGSGDLERVLSATMRTAFASVLRDPVEATNTELVASASPLTAAGIAASVRRLDPPLRSVAAAAAARLAPALSGGSVYTDDRAPVEWLVDSALLDYARGARAPP